MATYEQIQARLDSVEAIIASGVDRAATGDKSTDFRDLTQLYKVRDDLRRQLGQAVTTRRTVVAFNAGFR